MTNPDVTPHLPRILVVDDSRIVRATVRKHLSTHFDIIENGDGEAGWQTLLGDKTIQVLISDLSMPILDGFGLMDRVRKSPDARVKATPIIIISGEEDPETKHEACSRGANDFITKSTDRTEMIARVSAAVALAKRTRELHQAEAIAASTATTDAQTGVATRHLLEIEADKALALAKRNQTDVTVLMFELDHFDTLRGRVGDEVAERLIAMMAKLLASKLRKEETLARIRGPRFGVLVPAAIPASLVLAERLRQTIQAAKVNFRGESITISASCGGACTSTSGDYDVATLISAAESRLAEAIAAGGNSVRTPVAQPAMPPSIEAALELLRTGQADAVRPHLSALMVKLEPLLALTRSATSSH